MFNTKNIYIKLVVSLGIFLHLGCAPKKSKSDTPPQNPPEVSICGSVAAVADPITISGNAEYQYLKPVYQSGGLTLDAANGNVPFVKPIRRAEVRVVDSAGTVIQCGETDDTGNYSVQVGKPTAATSYIVEVNSRGDGTFVKASVLDKASTKKFYSLTTTVSISPVDSNVTVPALTALATGTLEGGAFHIFDNILDVNNYLREHTTDASCSLCQGFSVVPKVTIYWMKGFNPASYLGESSGLSFFDASSSLDSIPGLYILGGANGDVDVADTDHFDESVIIHEYGHFLEKTFWRTDSPGGIHNGNLIIDPRLAFSEGFANFLPAAVTGSPQYLDTVGSPYGSRQIGVYLNLEDEPFGSSSGRDKIISTSPVGEGIYREVSVSRALNDYIDAASDPTFDSNGTSNGLSETAHFPFAYLWLALTNPTFGLKSSGQHFVSMGQFNKSLYDGVNSSFTGTDLSTKLTDLATARNGEFQTNGTAEYGQLVVASGTTCNRTMSPVANRAINPGQTGPSEDYYYHDLFAASDFFRIDHSGGLLEIKLKYTASIPNNPPDFDLYLYRENHSVGDGNDLLGASDKCRNDLANASLNSGCSTFESPVGEEIISKNLPAGTYMILVNALTTSSFAGSSATYELTSGGQSLCNSQ